MDWGIGLHGSGSGEEGVAGENGNGHETEKASTGGRRAANVFVQDSTLYAQWRLGDYGSVTLLMGDTGHLSYGRSQTTLASGNLYLLIEAYCEAPGAQFGADLNPYSERLKECDVTLDGDIGLRSVLRNAGDDPVMRDVQDQFFDRIYWAPCAKDGDTLGINSALGTTVVYDSHIHGSWKMMRKDNAAKGGSQNG